MTTPRIFASASGAWRGILGHILGYGRRTSPRDLSTLEIPQASVQFPMRYPVVMSGVRKLGYKFMVAEAIWILEGRNDLKMLLPFAPRMAEFSDDGSTLAGAYGPMIHSQAVYVVNKLIEDPDTRQAVMTIWKPNPKPSKDIPCTISLGFQIRDGKLNMHVYMRSSDLWLGTPYDWFSEIMLAYVICCRLNRIIGANKYTPGMLYWTTASAHIYMTNLEGVEACIREPGHYVGDPVPAVFAHDENLLMGTLKRLLINPSDESTPWRIL